jgi:hypothetical protein
MAHILRILVEDYFRTLKERTKEFYNNFPAGRSKIENVKLFPQAFTY